jgi:peptidoglycan/xylan/chitin deacetylase (PgdA/CDA1 family)
MKLVSPLLKRVVYPSLSSLGYFRRSARNGELCVVTYHGVRPSGYVSSDALLDGGLVSADKLRAQLRLLKTRYNVISPEHFLLWLRNDETLPPLSILVTCDDGLRNVITDMFPVLQAEGVRCLFFITGISVRKTSAMLWYEELHLLLQAAPEGEIHIDEGDFHASCLATKNRRNFWWDLVRKLSARDAEFRSQILQGLHQKFESSSARIAALRHSDSNYRRFFLLNVDELRALSAQGMTIGAHTMHHPLLSECSDACAQSEIAASQEQLQAAIGQEVWALAYPFGDPGSITARELALAKSANFSCAFMNVGGGFGADLPPFALPRVHVTADMGLAEFEAHVSGFYRSLHRTVNPVLGVPP